MEDETWKEKLKTPKVGVAAIVESPDRKQILIIERKWPPLGYAFPGGFMDIGETIAETAIREVKEETGIDARVLELLNLCSRPEFDPRMHVVAPHLIMRATKFKEPKGMDDAKDAFWMKYDSYEFYDKFTYISLLTLKDYRAWRNDERRLSKLR